MTLFEPIEIGSSVLPNRLSVAPMCQYSAIEGCPTEWHYKHLGMLTTSGVSMLVFESTAVSADGRISLNDLVLENKAQLHEFTKLIKYLKALSSTCLILQLNHAGRKGSVNVPWHLKGSNLAPEEGSWKTYSASPIKRDQGWQSPLQMTDAKIRELKLAFKRSAKMAIQARFNGVEIHMAHGYLLHQFLSPISNKRTDNFGGSQRKRNRLPLEILEK